MDHSENIATEVTDTDRNDDYSITEQLNALVPIIPDLEKYGIEKKVLKSTKPNETASLFCGLFQLQCDCKNLSEETLLPEDSSSLLVTTKIGMPWQKGSSTFWWSFMVFIFQIMLLVLLLYDSFEAGLPIDTADWELLVAQYFAVTLMVVHNCDVTLLLNQSMKGFERRAGAFKIRFGYNPKKNPNQNEEDCNDGVSADDLELPPNMKTRWVLQLLFCRLLLGNLDNATTWMLIMQSDNVLDVILNFAALAFIQDLDVVAFSLFKLGLFGRQARNDAVKISDATINDGVPIVRFGPKDDMTGLRKRRCPFGFVCFFFTWSVFTVATTFVTFNRMVAQTEGYRCSQSIIDENAYSKAEDTCKTSLPFLLRDREKAERGNLNMVPLIVAIKTDEVDPFGYEWSITSPSNPDKISRGGTKDLYFRPEAYFGNNSDISPKHPEIRGVFENGDQKYVKAFCVPDNFCGMFSIYKEVPSGGNLFEYPGLYKIKSGMGDDYCGGGPVHYDSFLAPPFVKSLVSQNRTIERFLVGNCEEFLDWKEKNSSTFETDYTN